ncbi:Small heat shock protein, chloroplastic [Glycine soja]|uniref:Small heat shock protein, chloroplastic n=1 Tax=Glycine soja TaxID=3848 RepID=A0A445FMI3_GLYSO|nr:Small heat shock protein, chloroplastic [Glycine soja]
MVRHSLFSIRKQQSYKVLPQRQVFVVEAKGKKGMMSRQFQRNSPPPLPKIEDDGNPKFVIFIRMANDEKEVQKSACKQYRVLRSATDFRYGYKLLWEIQTDNLSSFPFAFTFKLSFNHLANFIFPWLRDRFPTARTVQEMMETMERMMEDPFAFSTLEWPSSPLPSEGVGGYRRRGRAPWEIEECEGEYKMRFDMPGMNKEDVKVWVEEKMLVVKAEKAPKKKQENEIVELQQEEEEWSAKSYGRYSSRIALPDNVQFENIKAEVKDGVLYITIPKAISCSCILDIQVQ